MGHCHVHCANYGLPFWQWHVYPWVHLYLRFLFWVTSGSNSCAELGFLVFLCLCRGVAEMTFFFFYYYLPQWNYYIVIALLVPSSIVWIILLFFSIESPVYALFLKKDIKMFNRIVSQMNKLNKYAP